MHTTSNGGSDGRVKTGPGPSFMATVSPGSRYARLRTGPGTFQARAGIPTEEARL